MRRLTVLLSVVASLCPVPAAWGQRVLSSAEIQQIWQQVTSSPRQTWIPAGTIQAIHQEYGVPKTTNATVIDSEIQKALAEYRNNPNKRERSASLQKMKEDAIPFNVRYRLANEYAMTSRVTVRYDGGKFYWEIDVDSRQDSVKPDASLAGNPMTRQFNRAWNDKRVFAWDGQTYTTYSASANRATVDAAGKMPHVVTGPLTAGLIPWGHGRYTLANLIAASTSAVQTAAGLVEMTVTYPDGSPMKLTLDPAKAYAVTKATLTSPGGAVAIYTCSYPAKPFGGSWAPSTVTIERQNTGFESSQPTSEQWKFTSVSAAKPAPGSFRVPLGANALVEHFSPLSSSSAIYVQSPLVDTDELLVQHLAHAAARGSRSRNCATAALQQVAAGFGKSVSGGGLAGLVGPNGRTSLYDLKRLAQTQGLYCRAVKTDLAGLANLKGAKAILHIPGRNHLVILDRVDEQYVWLIDLSSRKFYYRQRVDFFPTDWSEGTALLFSDRPIAGQFTELGDANLQKALGGTYWQCNNLIQEADVVDCIWGVKSCGGYFQVFFERWGCWIASSGTCDEDIFEECQQCHCIDDPYYTCDLAGDWVFYHMLACS